MGTSLKHAPPLLMAAGVFLLSALLGRPQSYSFSTLAGVGCGSADGTNSSARFFYPRGGATDTNGNYFIADSGNHTIRKITPAGLVTTIAGLAGVAGTNDGAATNARFHNPSAVAVDASGNVYVADTGNHTIRLISTNGTVSTIAGKALNYGGADGTNGNARFYHPMGIALDPATNLYIADTFNHAIRRLQKTGASAWITSTLAGTAGTNGSVDGTNALFNYPGDLAVDSSGNLYVADSDNHTIRTISPTGFTTTLAGLPGLPGSVDGLGPGALFFHPCSITIDGSNNLYVVDGGNFTIRKVSPQGLTATIAGRAGIPGNSDGSNSTALFNSPGGIAVDGTGTNIYLADTGNNTIRLATPAGQVSTLAGLAAGSFGSADGTNSTARFLAAQGMAIDPAGNVYVADTGNQTIRKVTPSGIVTTLAGTPGVSGTNDSSNGPPLFWQPAGLALDAATNLYVADKGNHTIRMVTPAGVVTTIAGTPGAPGCLDLPGPAARFVNPVAVAVDPSTNLYVADYGNAVIRKISPLGIVSTVAGLADVLGSTDGAGTYARFCMPAGLAVDASTNIYVADTGNHTIRLIGTNGTVSTIAGLAGNPGAADGASNAAQFFYPRGLAVDASSNLYVADAGNWTIRKITPARIVSTIGGLAGSPGVADDAGPGAQFFYPFSLAVDASSNLYVADVFNSSIRKGVPFLAPVLSGELLNQTVPGNSIVTFSVNAMGAGVLSYQWLSNGVAIAGATNASYIINTATPLNALVYSVVVSNAFGKVTSQSASLTVLGPANDLFANPAVVTGTNFTVTGSNVGATVENREPNILGNAGGRSVWWSWTAPADSTVTLSTVGSSFDTLLAVYKGTTLNNLTLLASSDDYSNLTSQVVFAARSGRNYRFTVDGYNAASGGIRLSLSTAPPVLPSITAAPLPQVDIPGANVAFSVGAAGSPPLLYQWRRNAANISGATSSTLTLSGIASNDVASYDVVVSSEVGSTNSGSAALSLTNGAAFNTLAGTPGYGSMDGVGAHARFHGPNDVANDNAGNLYVVDGQNNTIRKVTPAGVVTTFAGYPGAAGYLDLPGTNARFNAPAGIAVDAFTNIYVSDSGNNVLRKITSAGVVSTLAGLAGGGAYADGTNTDARFFGPSSLATDAAGNIYMADAFNSLIRKITPAGVVTTLAGLPGVNGAKDGTISNATFFTPEGVDIDLSSNIYVADTFNNTIRKITPDGTVSTLAGVAQVFGASDGLGSNSLFNRPEGLGVDPAGNVYVADTGNNTLRMITPAGQTTTLSGIPGVAGSTDGSNGIALLFAPTGITWTPAGHLVVADDLNNTIRTISTNAITGTLAGSAAEGTNDGAGVDARFNYPAGVAIDSSGDVYLADHVNSTIRKINQSGVVTTLAGVPGVTGSADGTNNGALFYNPSGIALDSATNLYVADTGNHTIRKITPAGVVTTFAGSPGRIGGTNGVGTNALFFAPLAVMVDAQSNVLVTDSGNFTVRMISPTRVVTTFAGVQGLAGTQDGPVSNALFGVPSGIALDAASNVYVTDTRYLNIRKISPDGTVSTLAGLAGVPGFVDGTGTTARFGYPYGISADAAGNLLVADLANDTLRFVTPQGMVRTAAGASGFAGSSDGIGTAVAFFNPQFVGLDNQGFYFVTDSGNFTVRTTRPPPPMLQISYAPNYAVLTWPQSATGYLVETSSLPFHNAFWSPLTNVTVITVGTNLVTSNIIGPAGIFYRLHKP